MKRQPYYAEPDGSIVIWNCDWREAEDLGRATVLVSDPPYGMAFRSGMGGAFGESTIANDETPEERDTFLECWGDKPALVFGRWSVPRPRGTKMVLILEKGNHVGMGDLSIPWKPNTEEIYVLGSGFVGHRGTSVLRYNAIAGTVGQAGTGTRHHPTEKPVDLMRDLLAKCPPDSVILDPFMGSGTTLRAAKDLGLRAIGCELDEGYCDYAARRLGQGVFAL